MMSEVSGPVVFVRNLSRIVGPPRVGGGRFVRNLSSFCQEFKPYRGTKDATSKTVDGASRHLPTRERRALNFTAL